MINNNTSLDLTDIEELIGDLLPFAQKRIGFNRPPTINFDSDLENASDILGKTAHYDPGEHSVVIYVDNRHPKDILRSLTHELVHHAQNLRGEFDDLLSTELGYAQNNPQLRAMEEEAYTLGNMCFRDWEDGRKVQKMLNESIYKYKNKNRREEPMSFTEKRLFKLNNALMKKFGYTLEEDLNPAADFHVGEATSQKELPLDEEAEAEAELEEAEEKLEERKMLKENRIVKQLNKGS